MSDMAIDLPLRPISVEDYHRMADAGIIEHDERVELLDGMLVKMPPIGNAHMVVHGHIVSYLTRTLGTRAFVAGQASLPLTTRDEPQPDITIFAPQVGSSKRKSWSVEDIYAAIEVSDSSLRRDLGAKLAAYARGGIAEYLIVDVRGLRLIRHLSPVGDAYERREILDASSAFALERLPEVTLAVAEMLGPAED